MDINSFCPYVRRAEHSVLTHPFLINTRVIYDYEIIYVADGKCTLTVKDVPYVCKKGDAVLLAPGIPHKFECADSDFAQPHLHFDLIYNQNSAHTPISFKNTDSMTEQEKKLIQHNLFEGLDIPCVFKPLDADKFKKLLYSVIRYFAEGNTLCVMARTLELIGLVLMQFDTGKAETKETVNSTSATVKSYIESNFTQILSLDGLALQFHINKFTLMRNFKAEFGINIMEFYRNKRIEYAKKALSETKLSVSGIAEQLCFNDIYSFSRFFKNFAGVSPSEYRKTRFDN